jgi:hypothetical protein
MLVGLVAGALAAQETIERYDDGKIKERYSTDAEGRKHGKYLAHHPNGKVSVRGQYKAGELDGLQTHFWESGKTRLKAEYRDGKLHGGYLETDDKGNVVMEEVYWDGRLLYPKSARQISATVNRIMGSFGVGAPGFMRGAAARPDAAAAADPLRDPANLYALARLNSYRYLCDVAYDVQLDTELCDYAAAGARLCARIGHLEHYPKNPGMPDEEFKKGYHGTSSSNLHQGGATRRSVDSYMDDSDQSNISVVGHRRWCLNPSMALTGFGESGVFSAMMVKDTSRKNIPDYDYVAYPPRGLLPLEFFGHRYAWHVSVNESRYRKPDPKAVKVAVWPIRPGKSPTDADPERRAAKPLEFDYFNVSLAGCGIPNAIIFRPVLAGAKEGDRFWVEITGLKKADGSDATIEYVVEFFKL